MKMKTKMRMKKQGHDSEPSWQIIVDHNRKQAMRVLNDIRQGLVNEEDFDKLHNFVQFSLALMQAEGPKKWALAKLNAEIMGLQPERPPP